MGISVPQAMYDDFVEVCKPVKEIRADYPFEVKVAKPFKRPTQSGGTDASVFCSGRSAYFWVSIHKT
mgnify:CR=1 FL=1